MRIYIRLTKNKEPIPFNYQQLLTGVIHKWIGENNEEHGKRSFYSFSWLQNTNKVNGGINFNDNSYFFFSAYNSDLTKSIMKKILVDPSFFYGSSVFDIQIKEVPRFSEKEHFILNSPILIRKREGKFVKHVTYLDEDFNQLLTENLKGKLKAAGLSNEGVLVEFDKNYAFPKTKLINYKGIKNKTTLAPVIIKGTAEQIAFAWQVGLGHSTGIGFGAIK